jgi:3-oxoacyl-[acyl-carrier-protein] synthase-3
MPLNAMVCDIAVFLPEGRLDNSYLEGLYPGWSADKIYEKTGIRTRAIAAADETAGDLAYGAARALFSQGEVKASDVDFLILCTQAPDHFLPSTACILQHRLGIPTSAGALDVNLGCSGYVYCLSLAKGLVETGAARCVLVLTADTYSKYIHPQDKSVRTLFGDGATASAVVARDNEEQAIGPFVFGTDGSGAEQLIVPAGGFRRPRDANTAAEVKDASGNVRSADHLYMNGAEVMAFTLREVPRAVNALLSKASLSYEDVDFFVLHQASRFMLEALRRKLNVPAGRLPIHLEAIGNTVSSTIPMTLHALMRTGELIESRRMVLVGFGVGLSWAACVFNFGGLKNE